MISVTVEGEWPVVLVPVVEALAARSGGVVLVECDGPGLVRLSCELPEVVDGQVVEEVEPEVLACGVDGCDFTTLSGQGLATHRARKHKPRVNVEPDVPRRSFDPDEARARAAEGV